MTLHIYQASCIEGWRKAPADSESRSDRARLGRYPRHLHAGAANSFPLNQVT
jgi:hypothetical protein